MPSTVTDTGKTEKNEQEAPSPVSGAVVDTDNKQGGQNSQGEGTQTGIFAGAEKFMDSDAKASKTAKEDISNEGTAVISNGKLDLVSPQPGPENEILTRTDVENAPTHHHKHSHHENHLAYSGNDLPPLPDLSGDVDDADFLAWLHENNEIRLDETTAKNIDPDVRKKYLRYLAELNARNRSRSNSLVPEGRTRRDSTLSSSGSSSVDSNGEPKERGPIKAIAHVLHLDRSDRKKAKLEKKQAEARLKEEMDMEQWKENLKVHHERKMSHGSHKHSHHRHGEASTPENDDTEKASSDATDSSEAHKAPNAVPMSLLNPEFLERKNEEEELLQSGGDLAALSAKKQGADEEGFASVSSDRITQLIESDRIKQESGQKLPEREENLSADQFKVTFHTADSFDRLDRVAGTS